LGTAIDKEYDFGIVEAAYIPIPATIPNKPRLVPPPAYKFGIESSHEKTDTALAGFFPSWSVYFTGLLPGQKMKITAPQPLGKTGMVTATAWNLARPGRIKAAFIVI
jgi:hypothetical protein